MTAPDEDARAHDSGALVRRILIAMLIGVALYGALVLVRGWQAIGAELARFAWWAAAAACGLSLANYALRFLKWEYYLGVLGVARDEGGRRVLPWWESLLVFLSGFVLTVTPGKVGEVFKSFVLFRLRAVPMTRTGPIVVAERLTDLIGVIALITVGGSTFPGGLFWAAMGSAVVLLLLALVMFPRLVLSLCAPLARLPGGAGRVVTRAMPKLELSLVSLRALSSPRHLLVPSLLSVCGWALEGVAVALLLRGFSQELPVLKALFFYATATLAGALVPVPGGLGVTEKVLEESMVAIGGVPGPIATATMIMARLSTLWFAVLVGFVALAILRAKNPALLGQNSRSQE